MNYNVSYRPINLTKIFLVTYNAHLFLYKLEHARMSYSRIIVVLAQARMCSYELLKHYTYCSFRLAIMTLLLPKRLTIF